MTKILILLIFIILSIFIVLISFILLAIRDILDDINDKLRKIK